MTTEVPALKHVIEALVFASEKPISAREIATALRAAAAAAPDDPAIAQFSSAKENEITDAVDELSATYAGEGRSFEVRETAAGWQLVTAPRFGPWLRQLYPEAKPARMSAPALETLAIIAYRQPVTRADIEAVRGVAVDGVMQTLLDRSLVRIAGRAEIPGRPLLYETTSHFMEHFGLRNLEELPNATELRRAALALAEQAAPADTTPVPVAELPLAEPENAPEATPPEPAAPAEPAGSESPAPPAGDDPSSHPEQS